MAFPEYEIHLDSQQIAGLWDDEEESSVHFFEDPDEIDRIIEEECGSPRRRRGRKKRK